MSPTVPAKDEEQLARRRFALDTMSSIGINPDVVCSDSLDVNGYETFKIFEDGKREVGPDGYLVREHHEWPSIAIGIHIVDLLIQSGWKQ